MIKPEQMLGDLLAVIHGYGGHYHAEHGLQKAYDDALAKINLSLMESDSVPATVALRNRLSRRFPRLTFAVSETAWHHGGISNESYVEFIISVQPGFNGLDCQNFSDNSLEKCLKKFNAVAGT